MQLTYAYFLERFRATGTEELLEAAVTRELTDEAAAALRAILQERGIEGHALELGIVEAKQAIVRRAGVTNECDYCGRSIAFGCVSDGTQRFCSNTCMRESHLHAAAFALAPDLIVEHANRLLAGACPQCGVIGKIVEMRPVHTVVSIIWWCQARRESRLCCRSCAVRANGWAIVSSLLFGWWSLPGLIATPVQVWRNLRAIQRDRFESLPSPELMHRAALDLAARLEATPALAADPSRAMGTVAEPRHPASGQSDS